MKKKIIYIVLTVIWMVVIFIMSSMNTNESNGKSKQTIKDSTKDHRNIRKYRNNRHKTNRKTSK